VFDNLLNLVNCSSCFGNSTPRKFYIKNSEDNTENINIDIKTIWQNNSKLTNVSGCFSGVYNIYCTGLTFHSSVGTIDISGLFGLSNNTYKSVSSKIFINIDELIPNIISNSYYSVPGNVGDYYGTF